MPRFPLHLMLGLMVATTPATASESLPPPPAEAPENTGTVTPGSRTTEELPLEQLRLFALVLEQIRDAYVEPVSDSDLLDAAIHGLLFRLDPHSEYLQPEDFSSLRETTSGEFGGIGIEVGQEDGFIKVVSPIDDTPASRAGIQPGDMVTKIDGTSVKGLTLAQSVERMRGKIGTKVTLTVVREGIEKPMEIVLLREKIRMSSVRTRELAPGFGYLRITQFQTHTGSDAHKQLKALAEGKAPLQGLVLDLRNNPGGVLSGAQQVADLFLDSGNIVYTEGRDARAQQRLDATPGDLLDGAPIVVLVNRGTASASEIVAGALQDHRRAVIVGTQTFGKGSVQTVLPLQGERGLKLTTARYFTPSGRSIQAEGIVPDIRVENAKLTTRDESGMREAELPGHLGNGKARSSKTSEEKPVSLADEDYLLYEALNILRGIALARAPATPP